MTLGIALALAALIGLALGLLGSGGSIITLPVLVYVAGIPPHQAVGMSLVIVGGTSAVGSLLNIRRGTCNLRAVALVSLGGMAGAFGGAKFTHLVSPPVLLLLFGILMLVVGARMLGGRNPRPQAEARREWRGLVAGVAVGVLTGFLGVGGGVLVLPALVLFAGLDMKSAIGSSLAVIALNCLGGLIGHLRYESFNWPLTLAFLLLAIGGMAAGTLLATRLSAAFLRRGFACCVLLLGIALVGGNLLLLVGAL